MFDCSETEPPRFMRRKCRLQGLQDVNNCDCGCGVTKKVPRAATAKLITQSHLMCICWLAFAPKRTYSSNILYYGKEKSILAAMQLWN